MVGRGSHRKFTKDSNVHYKFGTVFKLRNLNLINNCLKPDFVYAHCPESKALWLQKNPKQMPTWEREGEPITKY